MLWTVTTGVVLMMRKRTMISQQQHTNNMAVRVIVILLPIMSWLCKNPFVLLLASLGIRRRPVYYMSTK
jgi:hypothetical protein